MHWTVAQASLALYVKSAKEHLSNSFFTLHGFRSGAAVSLALADVMLNRIMAPVGWESSKTTLHYIKLKKVVNPKGAAAKLSNINVDTGKT